MKLEGKTALVTGGGSGIGLAIARLLATEGASILVAELNQKAGEAAAQEINRGGGDARFILTDTSREDEVKAAIDATLDAWGRLDVLVNNAGITALQHSWEEVISVNLSGVYYGCLHGLAPIKSNGGGSIINMSSMAGLVGASAPGVPGGFGYPYGASKHGVIGLTRQFALDGAPEVRVNCICPGFVDTPLIGIMRDVPEVMKWAEDSTPMGRLARPEEIAKAALFLACDDSSYMTGAPLIVDGGWTAR